jgi:DNA-binding response OmpR family regulator
MSGDRDKAIAAGCDDYHAKPIDFSQLLNQIEAALTSRSATS